MKRYSQRQQEDRENDQNHRTDAPSGVGDHPHEERQKYQLTRRTGAAENSQRQPAPRDKPAISHRGGQHRAHAASAQTYDDAPNQKKLPELGHGNRAADPSDQKNQAAEHDLARPEAVDQPATNRRGDAKEQQIHADPRSDQRPAPAELQLQRKDQDLRRRAHACAR